jgi:hypothetical protein
MTEIARVWAWLAQHPGVPLGCLLLVVGGLAALDLATRRSQR